MAEWYYIIQVGEIREESTVPALNFLQLQLKESQSVRLGFTSFGENLFLFYPNRTEKVFERW